MAKGGARTAKGTVKLTGDRTLEAKGKTHKVQGRAQDAVGDARGLGRLQPILVSAAGAVMVVVVAGLLTGLLRIGRGPS